MTGLPRGSTHPNILRSCYRIKLKPVMEGKTKKFTIMSKAERLADKKQQEFMRDLLWQQKVIERHIRIAKSTEIVSVRPFIYKMRTRAMVAEAKLKKQEDTETLKEWAQR